MSHATHANAALTPRARLRVARLIVDHKLSPARAAERYDVSWRTAAKWAARCSTAPGRLLRGLVELLRLTRSRQPPPSGDCGACC